MDLIFYIIEIIDDKPMNDLSRKEKLVISTIWKMKDKPYGLNIMFYIVEIKYKEKVEHEIFIQA